MAERQLLRVGVECYAGHRGEQTPRTLILGDRRIAVAEVLDAWLAPDYRYFKLRGADGDTYLVRHDECSDAWELTMFRADRIDGSADDQNVGWENDALLPALVAAPIDGPIQPAARVVPCACT